MSNTWVTGVDDGLRVIENLIDNVDGQVDARTAYVIEKILQKNKRLGLVTDVQHDLGAAVAAAPTAPAPAPASPPVVAGGTITRLVLGKVQPGDLITADFANSIIEALLTLDNRLALLEKAAGSASTTVPQPGNAVGPATGGSRVPNPIIQSAQAKVLGIPRHRNRPGAGRRPAQEGGAGRGRNRSRR
jgi:hypothetical protein